MLMVLMQTEKMLCLFFKVQRTTNEKYRDFLSMETSCIIIKTRKCPECTKKITKYNFKKYEIKFYNSAKTFCN